MGQNSVLSDILTFKGNITEIALCEVERSPVVIKFIFLTICYDYIHKLRKRKISILNYKMYIAAILFKFVSISRDQSTDNIE